MSAPNRSALSAITACRSCGASGLAGILDLGTVPLANALRRAEQLADPEPRFPLTLLFCPACSLVQIRETVDPRLLFGEYVYFSSFSETMLAHAREHAAALVRERGLGPQSFVVEIASNDGYLLRYFVEHGIPCLGIEPARNVAEAARAAGVPTACEFFDADVGRRLAAERGRADVIIANNVLAHVADVDGMAAGIAALLAPLGRARLEFPYVRDMIENVEFDTIYHEHLCYFSLHAAQALFARHGLALTDVVRLPIHGGSLRIELGQAGRAEPSPAVAALLVEERERGLLAAPFYLGFAAAVRRLGDELTGELRRRKAAGQRLAAYGASAKGSTLLNACGIGADLLDFIVDRSTVKQGCYAPGNALPILPPAALLERRPDAVLLLTWNFAEEICRQQRAYLDGGGVFIVPVPRVRTLGPEDAA